MSKWSVPYLHPGMINWSVFIYFCFVFKHHCELIDCNILMYFNSLHLLFLFMFKLFHIWPVGASLSLFSMTLAVINLLFAFLFHRMFQVYPLHFCSRPGMRFSRGILVPIKWEMVLRCSYFFISLFKSSLFFETCKFLSYFVIILDCLWWFIPYIFLFSMQTSHFADAVYIGSDTCPKIHPILRIKIFSKIQKL